MSTSKTFLFSFSVAAILAASNSYAQNMPVQAVANQPFVPIAYATNAKQLPLIPEKNIPWKKRVSRAIDGNDEKNKDIFIGSDEQHTNVLANILQDGITKGIIKAYSATTDGFITVLSAKEIAALTPVNTYKFKLKEDWLFVSNDGGGSGHMEVRVVGLAPVTEINYPDGTKSEQAEYWIYYPDCRNFLHQYTAVNSKNGEKQLTWDEYFEGRNFISKIDKVIDLRDNLPK